MFAKGKDSFFHKEFSACLSYFQNDNSYFHINLFFASSFLPTFTVDADNIKLLVHYLPSAAQRFKKLQSDRAAQHGIQGLEVTSIVI